MKWLGAVISWLHSAARRNGPNFKELRTWIDANRPDLAVELWHLSMPDLCDRLNLETGEQVSQCATIEDGSRIHLAALKKIAAGQPAK